jgi:hypothetical protein
LYRDDLQAALSRLATMEAELKKLKQARHQDQQKIEELEALLARERERQDPSPDSPRPAEATRGNNAPPRSGWLTERALRNLEQLVTVPVMLAVVISPWWGVTELKSVASGLVLLLGVGAFYYLDRKAQAIKGDDPLASLRRRHLRVEKNAVVLSVVLGAFLYGIALLNSR